jgi:ABC-type uncharacterized transport system involved in gliding motility auxiliary subunit
MASKDSSRSLNPQKVLAGVNFAVYTLAVIAIIVLVNVLVYRYADKRWDLTPNQQFSISPQTAKILKGLKSDVDIYVFDRQQNFRQQKDLLDNYAAASHHVHVNYIDPDRDPSRARQYGIRTYGTVVVAAGDRHYEAQSATEEGITNALIRLLKGQKTACFIQGQGEGDLESTDRSGYSNLKKAFENEGYATKTVVLLQKLEIPSDCSMLVIAGPRNDYPEPEVDVIKKYVDGGGRLLVMLDPGTELPNLAKMLADWNVTVRNDLAIDENPIGQLYGSSPSMPLIIKYGDSPIVEPMKRVATLFPLTRSFEIGKESKSGITATSLCETSPDSFSVTGFNRSMRTVSFRPGKDVKGPLSVAVAGTVASTGSDSKKEGRFVAFGTSQIASNVYINALGNHDLLMNAVNWLSAEEDLISIRPKPPEAQRLNLTVRQMTGLALRMLIVPLVVIFLGVMVWWGRR